MNKLKRPVNITPELNKATDELNIEVYTVYTTFEIHNETDFLHLEEIMELIEPGDLTVVKQTTNQQWTIEIHKSKAAALKKEAEKDQSLYTYSNFR